MAMVVLAYLDFITPKEKIKMFKAIKNNKIIAINETGEFPCMEIRSDIDEVIEDTEHQVSDYKHYDGEFTLHDIEKDNEEMKQARANAYAVEVDPLMAEYNRKKTFNLFEEGEEEALLAEVNAKVEEIKQRFPYPLEETNNLEIKEVIEDGVQR